MKTISLYLTICISFCHHIRTEQQLWANVLLNHNLASGYCLKHMIKTSYSECYAHFESGNVSFNAMVYRRSFLLCSLCYVSSNLSVRKEPGFVLVHTPISDTSAKNLALNKPTNQSSTYYTFEYGNASSFLAVDGKRQTAMIQPNGYACAQTVGQTSGDQWWIVDLGEIYSVSKVVIYNRNDACCDHWLKELYITVGESEKSMHLCNHYPGPPGETEPSVTIMCQQPLLGKFVQISKTIDEGMAFCEVEVYH